MRWGINVSVLECLAQNSHSKNGAFKKISEPSPSPSVSSQSSNRESASYIYLHLLFGHPCWYHVFQILISSDLDSCNVAFSSPCLNSCCHIAQAILYSTQWSVSTKYVYWLMSPQFPPFITFLPQTSASNPTPCMPSSSASFLTSLHPPHQGSYCSPLPFLHWGTIYLFHSHIFDSCLFYSAHYNLPCNISSPGELILWASA